MLGVSTYSFQLLDCIFGNRAIFSDVGHFPVVYWRVHIASRLAKSVEQLGWEAWLSNLNTHVWTTSWAPLSHRTKSNRLRHPVWLNVGKHHRKVGRLRSLEGLHMHSNYFLYFQKINVCTTAKTSSADCRQNMFGEKSAELSIFFAPYFFLPNINANDKIAVEAQIYIKRLDA